MEPGHGCGIEGEDSNSPEQNGRGEEGEQNSEEKWAERCNSTDPSNDPSCLPRLEDHRHLLERACIAYTRKEEDGEHSPEEDIEISAAMWGNVHTGEHRRESDSDPRDYRQPAAANSV